MDSPSAKSESISTYINQERSDTETQARGGGSSYLHTSVSLKHQQV